MTNLRNTERPSTGGLILLAVLGAALLGPPVALGDSTTRSAPPERYLGPSGEVTGGLSSILVERPPMAAEERTSDDWARWEFWFEYEKDSLLRDARSRLVNEALIRARIADGEPEDRTVNDTDLKDRILPVLRKALEDADPMVRAAANLADANAGDRESLPLLVYRLTSRRADERRSAALGLGFLGESVAIPSLLERVEEDPDLDVRSYAAMAVGLIGDASAAPSLRRALDRSMRAVGHDHREFQVSLVTALGHLKDRDSAPYLQHLLRRAVRDDRLRAHAATALGRLGLPAAVPPLVQLLENDGDAGVRRSAVRALGAYDDRGTVTALRHALDDDGDALVRGLAAISLARSEGAEAVETLAAYTAVRHRRSLRGFAAVALGLTGNREKAAPHLRAILNLRSEDSLRAAAAVGLGLLGDEEAAPALRRVARDSASSPDLRGYAMLGAAMVGDRTLLPDTRRAVEAGGRVEEARSAVLALAVLPEPGNAAVVARALLTARHPVVRGAAILGLGLSADRAVVPLIADLADESGRRGAVSRMEAVTALGQLARRGELPPVARLCMGLNYRALTPALDTATRVF